jgi:predicted glycosyltransferase
MKTAPPRALIYVQHLLGIGHLVRVSRIAAALARAGVGTTLIRGGTGDISLAAPGVWIEQLPPARVEADAMTTLLHPDGRPFSDADKERRRDLLLAAFHRASPHILVVEAFPFGRRAMRFELLPLLEAATEAGTPVVAASVRDILQTNRKPGRAGEAAALVERFFDLVLVHGDERTTPLSLTFPLADRIAPRVRYTGLVGPYAPKARTGHDVVVSAGGGAVGMALLTAAIAAAPLSAFARSRWLALSGPNLPDADFDRLRAMAAGTNAAIDVMRLVTDLPERLAAARLSISQAGYNTVADVIAAGCRSVLVPFAAGGETEQTMRAGALADVGRAAVIAETDLTPMRLSAAIDAAMALPAPAAGPLDGAERAAAILLETLAARKTFATRPALLSSSVRS